MEYVEVARAESERGEVVLRERRVEDAPGVLELRVNGVFVMDTQETGSERALARTALELCPDPRTVLVGGLGLGFTAHELLSDVRVERVDVVEIEPAVVRWMRDGTVPHGPELLADRRLQVIEADITGAIAEAREATYDLVLLDVDNGPGHLVHEQNGRVYEEVFLRQCHALLTPDGVAALWSANEAPELEATMAEVFGDVDVISYEVDLQGRAEAYLLYVGVASRA